ISPSKLRFSYKYPDYACVCLSLSLSLSLSHTHTHTLSVFVCAHVRVCVSVCVCVCVCVVGSLGTLILIAWIMIQPPLSLPLYPSIHLSLSLCFYITLSHTLTF